MSRRAHQHSSGNKVALILGLAVILGLAGSWGLQNLGGKYRTLEKLDPSTYYENSNSLKGNTYLIEGTISNALGSNPAKGRLFSILIASSNRNWVLPIFVPKELMGLNIQKNQKYLAKVKINDQGILLVMEISKP